MYDRCTISLALSGLDQSSEAIINHVGWSTRSSFERYSRITKLVDRGVMGTDLAGIANHEGDVEREKFLDGSKFEPFL